MLTRFHQSQDITFRDKVADSIARLAAAFGYSGLLCRSIIRKFCSALHREEFTDWIIQTACQMNEMMNRERDTTRRVIREAKRYIQENYQNPDLLRGDDLP